MSFEIIQLNWRQTAQKKIDDMHRAHEIEISAIRKSRKEALLGGASLALTGVANIADLVINYMPEQWRPYAIGASVLSGSAVMSGLIGKKEHRHRAATDARVAIAYALPNDIALPEWTHPYIEQSEDIFVQGLAVDAKIRAIQAKNQ